MPDTTTNGQPTHSNPTGKPSPSPARLDRKNRDQRTKIAANPEDALRALLKPRKRPE